MKDVTKGPGDLWIEEEDHTMDGFEEWLESIDDDPHKKLELMERFITYTRSATGTVMHSMESPYGTIATVSCELDSAYTKWLGEVYVQECVNKGGW